MFFTQVVIPVIIIAGVSMWAGMRLERIRRAAKLRKAAIDLQAWARERRRGR